MKIFGKKSNVLVVVVVMAAFLAGCSNLWDYQPKSSNNKKPTDQTPPPQEQLKPLSQGGNSVDSDLDSDGLLDALSDGGFTDDGGSLAGDDGTPVAGSPFAGKAPTGKPVLDGLLVKKPDGTTIYLPLDDDGKLNIPTDLTIPKGSTIEPIFREADDNITPFKVKVTGADGEVYEIPVELPEGEDKATWAQIQDAVDGLDIKLIPDGYTLDKVNGSAPNGTKFSSGDDITLTFKKEVSYTVGGQSVKVTLQYPESEATWAQIKAAAVAAGVDIGSKTWQDQNGDTVSDSKKYPAGTSFSEYIEPPAGEMKPEGMSPQQADEYDNIETSHKDDVNISHLLTEWSCKTGDFYQYLIFYVFDGVTDGGYIFYGAFDNTGKGKTSEEAKDEARKKAEEAKTYFNDSLGADYKISEDCSTGWATIENMEKISIGLMPAPGNIKPESSKNIEGAFYMSNSGKLIARPETGSGEENDFKIGFVWEK